MSDNIPLEIQHEIIKRLPIKPLLQFRSVSKSWKSLIDSSEFINAYHIIHKHPQRLLLRYETTCLHVIQSIIDNDTFPQNTSLVPVPESIKLLGNPLRVIGLSNGLFCFHCYFPKIGLDTQRVVLWNPFLRKTVDIVIPCGSKKKVPVNCRVNVFHLRSGVSVVGFGVCPETTDVKLVMINSSIPTHWVVKVSTLSSRAWRSVSFDPPFKSCDLSWEQESVNGFIYWLGYDDVGLDRGIRANLIVLFDLKSEMFGQVHLPDILVHSEYLGLSKRNECLTVLEYIQEGEIGVWMMKDGVTKSFTKMFTVESHGPSLCMGVLGFRKNGEAIIVTRDDVDDDTIGFARVKVFDPCSGHINDTRFGGIGGIGPFFSPFSVSSYVETLLLLDIPPFIEYNGVMAVSQGIDIGLGIK